jgi:diketogulonate reductase-like aldo/keto reductase
MERNMHPGFGTGQLKGDTARLATLAAIETGYTIIDTGEIYGNEAEIGQVVRSSSPRHLAENFATDDFVLSEDDMRVLNGLRGAREFRDPHTLE